ncbi:Chs5p-Arf1p-binding proteins-domain-containing protein [Armillaria luteobubalina]|uniref:Chs5p-Arf1p-binding proteins-domain-containing protein n=1 Tax=Armillaria luteobubalina TaxID=153913 RepID=A0AA39Q5X4_9AGAR|nr:Chs5p-Arf1p-binding proteins-domain-containing protein [Armillaria luteobubalina]
MAEATFKDIPELFEVELGESLTARTESLATFRELGPPDLCHVVKSNGKSAHRDLGSYHYISGVDASSSASLAAYINSLTYAIEDSSAWFAKTAAWKVRNGCYCCFNAFSRVDIRVDVKIPGGVNAYVIDLRGESDPGNLAETYVSALLRSILYSDDPPEIRFLQAAESLFMKGTWIDPEIQVATVYFGDSGRFQQAANLFEKISAKEPEVASLLARSYIGMRKFEWALKLARQAVNCAPSEFVTWEKLTETLPRPWPIRICPFDPQSCPMFTFNGRDAHRNLTPSRVHLPFQRPDCEADPALQRLPSPGLRGTWARAYTLLTRLVSQIGWDELLKTRSSVFVMEEEYRMQKAQGEIAHSANGSSTAIHEDGSKQPFRTIRISTESDRDAREAERKETEHSNEDEESSPEAHDLERLDKKEEDTASPGLPPEPFSFSNKRLCERWLDNLFMVLYEDLRVWTIFRAEVAHFKTQHAILGCVYHHKEEAKEAYQRCFGCSPVFAEAWAKLMEMYAEEGDIQRSIQTAIRVAAYQYADYTEMTYPTQIARSFFKLGQIHGHAKISNTLISMGLPDSIYKIMDSYLQYGKTFKVEGYDF